jgi:hypothetical protein
VNTCILYHQDAREAGVGCTTKGNGDVSKVSDIKIGIQLFCVLAMYLPEKLI